MQSLANITSSLNLKSIPKQALEQAKEVDLTKFEADNTRKLNELYLHDKQRAMYKSSVFNEQGVLDQHFKDFRAETAEQKNNLLKARKITKRIIDGEKFKAVFTGSAGSGKTMLSVCVMNYVYENTNMSCLFVSVPKLMDWERVRAGGSDERRAINLEKRIQNADLVVWDDLASETALKHPDKDTKIAQASEHTQKVLFYLADSRKGKNDVFTTNNTSKELMQIYNHKLISRMLTEKPENIIQFSGKDQRMLQN